MRISQARRLVLSNTWVMDSSIMPAIDPTLDTWPATICTQIIQCLSISCSCCLYLKPFLDSVESGLIRSDDMRRRGSDYTPGGASTKMKPLSKPCYAANIEGGPAGTRDDWESQNSRTQIIKETRTFAVETFPNLPNTSPFRSIDVH